MEKTSLNLDIMLLLKNLDRVKDILHKRMILLIDNILNNRVQEKEVIEVVILLLSISINLESRALSKIEEGLEAGLLLPEEVKEVQEDLKRMYELDSLNKTIYYKIRLNLEENGN